MKRRAVSRGLAVLAASPFVTIGVPVSVSIPFAATAQGKVVRIGLMANNGPDQEYRGRGSWREEVLERLQREGFTLGSTLELVERYAGGDAGRFPTLAREIAAAKVDIGIAISDQAVRAMMDATATTPIVMVVGGDPLQFVASLARPGGRVTGIAFQTAEGDAKRLQFLREAMPSARRFGYLRPPGPVPERAAALLAAAARQLNVDVVTQVAARLDLMAYEAAFSALRRDGAAGVLIASTAALSVDAARFGPVAQSLGLPTICEWDHMARVGCVLAYGHDIFFARRRVGEYAARILKGAIAGDLPVEQSDAWRLTVNIAAARGSGMTLPPALLARADEVIE